MKLDVLAIGAHPDDVDLSCGGTIIKLGKLGKGVGIVDLTRGEMGTRGTQEIRLQEALDAAKVLGVTIRENLGLPDGNIEGTMENKLPLVQVIRKYRPDVLLMPYWMDRHPDHEHAYTLSRESWFLAGLLKVETFDDGKRQEPWRPRAYYHYMQWHQFAPTFIVDITDEFEQRMECVRAFRSQFYDPSSQERETVLSTPEFLEMLKTRMAYFGDRIGVRFGEPFFSEHPVKIHDIHLLNT
ncbi:MAG: bacillithiol biosynthesis deacetylase BshB1 [Bacteroidota bacterium]